MTTPPKQKRFWNYIKSPHKGCPEGQWTFCSNHPLTMLAYSTRQLQSVFAHRKIQIPKFQILGGKSYPDMNNMQHVSEEGNEETKTNKKTQKTMKATGPDMIPGQLLKACSVELTPVLASHLQQVNPKLELCQTTGGRQPMSSKSSNMSALRSTELLPCLTNLPLLQGIRAHHSQAVWWNTCDQT